MSAGTATPPVRTIHVVPRPHDCHAESVRELEGWRFDGYRCRYCLRRTPGPRGRVLQEPTA